jgi:hypothetical protein
MATLALAAVGAAAGGALLPGGISLLGATLSGAALGSQIGALAGSYVDSALFGAGGSKVVEGPRLQKVHLTASTEGAPVPRLYGRARAGGQVIWADEIIEKRVASSAGGSGKGVGGKGQTSQKVEYQYFASFAVAICEGEITGLGRVWADGRELDLTRIITRLYTGSEAQAADALISAKLGADAAPGFRGTAYVVFQELPLAEFGNRIPQLSFEVSRAVDKFGDKIRGAVLIPGSGEFVYATQPVSQTFGLGRSRPENVHTLAGDTDWQVAVDQLQAALPNASAVSLVVSWFGTDLRAGNCQIKPGVERTQKTTAPLTWSVCGVDRHSAYVVSTRDGRPAYGGTPSDQTAVAAIEDLKARGLDVILTPFILMDVPEGNTLGDPYGGSVQGAYPWRGRITCDPAPVRPGTVDKTAAAAVQIAQFVGTATPNHFSLSGKSVVYSGPNEWSLRRMVLHHAFLAKAAGGVSAFVIGSELRGLTTVRSSTSHYPFVAALVSLAADVKAVLGPSTKVTYAADWTEYFGHQPQDGTGDVYFHLDPLWASPAIDAVSIDCYWPLADWREGSGHVDERAGWRSVYDPGYLRANVRGGEGFDWYYASAADRVTQTRTPITDGSGKPWVFRSKDIRSWWSNAHYNRPGGIESSTPTAWVPQSKPFWFTEIGCPAVDKGANQPNVFVDPKSSENALPHFSRGTRDDLIQRRVIDAMISTFDPEDPAFDPAANPVSAVYGGRMVSVDRILPYCWDARPYPAFPSALDVWGDGSNWELGHWLNGRMAGGALDATLKAMMRDFGFDRARVEPMPGTVQGYVLDRVLSAREALQPLELAYFFDVLESCGEVAFRPRGQTSGEVAVAVQELVETKAGSPLLTVTRGQESDLPASAKITYVDAARDYQPAVAEARRLTGASGRVAQAEVPIVMDTLSAQPVAETQLFEAWSVRERFSFTLPPSRLAVEPGDVLTLTGNGLPQRVKVREIGDHGARDIEGRAFDAEVYRSSPSAGRQWATPPSVSTGQPVGLFLDLPLLRGDEPVEAGYVAASQSPWPGGVAVYSSPETTGFVLRAVIAAQATLGITATAMGPGPLGVFDYGTRVRVEVAEGQLASISTLQACAGGNLAAVETPEGDWEVFQFLSATLVAPGVYELSGLLRGQAGTEHAMRAPLAAGAPFVLLDESLARLPLTPAEVGLALNWRYGPSSRDAGDASYVAKTHAFRGVGARPYAPVHARGSRSGGDLTVTWIRRTRVGGDTWSVADVPLSELFERYEADVLDVAGAVKRTLAATSPSVFYSAAQQIADFGAPQPAVSVRIHQIGGDGNRGPALAAVV